MVSPTRTLVVPLHSRIADENGRITQPWIEFFSFFVDQVKDIDSTLASHGVDIGFLETAAGNMADIADQSAATATQIANFWQDFRSDLQNI